jgi:protoporphyrinogen/coproporphyrinogen III oxidase
MGKTVVIGGGTSGLAAAYTLQKAGVDCIVLEKREFSGGRIYGVEKEGFTLDLGAQFFFSRYRTTFDLMRQLGIYDQLVKFAKPMGILRDGTVHVVSPRIIDNIKHPTQALKFKAISNHGKREGVKMALKMLTLGKKLDFDDPLKAIELDNVSFADYARRNWGDEILEYAIQPIASTLTLGDPEDISAAYGLALAWYFVPGLSTTTKGIGYLAESLAKNVKSIELNTEATRIVMEDGKVKGVEIKSGSGKDFIEADNVICGTLAPEAAELLPALPAKILDTLNGIEYSSCAHVMYATKGKVIDDIYAIATPRREGLSMAGFTDNANKAPTYAPPNTSLVHVFTFGKHAKEMLEWNDAKIQEFVTHELQSVVPAFPDEPIFCEIFRWPQAVCLSIPGQITSVQKMKVALREYRSLHLVGEYFGMPSVEGSLNSGVKAAEKVLRAL